MRILVDTGAVHGTVLLSSSTAMKRINASLQHIRMYIHARTVVDSENVILLSWRQNGSHEIPCAPNVNKLSVVYIISRYFGRNTIMDGEVEFGTPPYLISFYYKGKKRDREDESRILLTQISPEELGFPMHIQGKPARDWFFCFISSFCYRLMKAYGKRDGRGDETRIPQCGQ